MKKIFISHNHDDKAYAEIIIDVLEKIGIPNSEIFCSSVAGYGTSLGDNFFNKIKELLIDDIVVIFLLSKDYYKSPLSLCEMGACWITAKKVLPILIPPLTSDELKDVFGSHINFRINDSTRLTFFKEKIEELFDFNPPSIKGSEWERYKIKILEDIQNRLNSKEDFLSQMEDSVRQEPKKIRAQSNKSELHKSTNVDFVKIDSGTFKRLSDNKTIELTHSFWMSKHLVTQELFERVSGFNPSVFRGRKLPVESILFNDAVTFCNQLSDAEGLEPVYRWKKGGQLEIDIKAKGYRLPFEMEWDCVLSYTKQELEKKFDEIAWHSGNSFNKTHPVGQLGANDFELFDLIGNVREWCFDNFTIKPNYEESSKGYHSNIQNRTRVLKGGSYTDIKATLIRNHFRMKQLEKRKNKNCGFRVVLQNK